MRKIRRALALVAAVAMLLACAVPACAESKFTDLDGHWSQTYMEALVEKGIIGGYSDGTIKPDKTLTAAEAFVMLANLYDLSDEAKDQIWTDYGSVIESNSSVTWANKQLAICMAAGIFTESELKNISLSAEMPKQNLSVYMVRAMQMTDKAEELSDAKLEYNDASSITSKCLGSIAALTELKIVSGDTNGNFTPKASVTRAVFSTMLCNIINYLDENNIELSIDNYSGLELTTGIITAVSSSKITVRDLNGIYHSFTKDTSLKTTVNGSTKTMSTSMVGSYVKLQSEEGKATTATITMEDNVSYKQGIIEATENNNGSLRLADMASGESAAYIIGSAPITLDGTVVNLETAKGAFATIKLEGKTVKEITATAKEYTVTGTLDSRDYASIVTATLGADKAADTILYMDLSSMPTIKRGTLTITIDRLNDGESVKATIKGGVVTEVKAEGVDAAAKGTLDSITRTRTETSWTIEKEDGSKVSYTLASNVSAYDDEEKAIKIDSINPGDEVSVTVTSGTITEVSLDKAYTAASDKISAEVLAVNTKTKTLTVLLDGKLVYINCSTTSSILNIETGKTSAFSAFTAGDQIIVYGSYSDTSNFTATSIVIELKK